MSFDLSAGVEFNMFKVFYYLQAFTISNKPPMIGQYYTSVQPNIGAGLNSNRSRLIILIQILEAHRLAALVYTPMLSP
ncbi:MAG: hypothetical protein IPK03_01060 [Bacteroidetes bacterium]|nr:hypothetical protein [Bacteroidota bacterium]